ncbi:MAG: MGH1-like glycoside hydrolase domain-containing protein [bacterium]
MNGIVKIRETPAELPYYEVPDAEMGLGASLGNGHAWVNTGPDGRILSLFSTDVGQTVAGPLLVRYATQGAGERGVQPNIPLMADGTGTFEIHPSYQCHHFRLPGAIFVSETVCLPQGEPGSPEDVCAAYYIIELSNRSHRRHEMRVFAVAGLAGGRRQMAISAAYDPQLQGIVATRPQHADGHRVFAATIEPAGHALTADLGMVYDPEVLPELNGPDEGTGELLGCLAVPAKLEPGQHLRLAFLLVFASTGREAVAAVAQRMQNFDPIIERSRAHHRRVLSACQVSTPDPVVNEGALWAKVNMLRVLAHYPQGEAFTNEPGVSSNVVTRDVVWFIYGCDHFLPATSRRLLDALVRSQHADGKIPEYYNAITGATEDYGLNISDPTPLFVLAVNHHVRSTGDFDYLRQVYESIKQATEYILAQRDERGLVFCTSTGSKEHGIASWRNVIPDYQISGAVTEINAECSAALRAMGHLAENLGQPQEEVDYFTNHAKVLAEAIRQHLLDPQRQLYLLNISPDGRRHTDVTADEVFPVLFRVADDATAYRIIRRLDSPDFWSAAGLRTASRLDPRYEPTSDVGLVGGAWPGMTWWFAFAAARYHPDLMVRALRSSFEHYNRHPRVYHTVPGQFSEWFDGESLINRGMRLSPWEPPRFLWAAVEGVAGLMIGPGLPCLNPLRPADWLWTAVRRLWYHGQQVSFFTTRQNGRTMAYSTIELRPGCACEVELFDADVTDAARVGHSGLHVIALCDTQRTVIAIGSCRDEAIATPIDLGELLEPDSSYELRQLSSEQPRWTEPVRDRGEHLHTTGVRVAARGYRLLELRRLRT